MAVVLDCSTEEKKWTDAKKLFNYGFLQYSQYSMTELLNQMQTEICSVKIDNVAEDDPNGDSMLLKYGSITGGDVQRMIQRNSEKAMQLAQEDIRKTLNVQWKRELVAPVTAGEVLGTVSFSAPDGTLVSADLIATRNVAARPEPTPTPEPTAAPKQAGRSGNGETIEIDVKEGPKVNPRNTGALRLLTIIIAVALLAIAILLVAARRREVRRRREMQRRRAARRRRAQAQHRRSTSKPRDL